MACDYHNPTRQRGIAIHCIVAALIMLRPTGARSLADVLPARETNSGLHRRKTRLGEIHEASGSKAKKESVSLLWIAPGSLEGFPTPKRSRIRAHGRLPRMRRRLRPGFLTMQRRKGSRCLASWSLDRHFDRSLSNKQRTGFRIGILKKTAPSPDRHQTQITRSTE